MEGIVCSCKAGQDGGISRFFVLFCIGSYLFHTKEGANRKVMTQHA